jgi:hypothetical protein
MMKRTFTAVLLLSACGGRPDAWDAPVELPLTREGLSGSVALIDPALDRVLMLTATSAGRLRSTPLPIGKGVVTVASSPKKDKLFVLARGVQPRRNPGDELPSLSVIDGGLKPTLLARYELTDPLQGLAIDPQGRWAVVHDAGGVVVNPNELIFVDLDAPDSTPKAKTIRSFGGRPERLTFTAELTVPKGAPRRFLIVETNQDVTLIDLSDLDRDEITIKLPKTPYGKEPRPLEVAYHNGQLDDDGDARIAIRLQNDPNVVLAQLAPPDPGVDKPFQIVVNVADVGGIPSAIDFVQTDGGIRLAALVPGDKIATLVDPATTNDPETVELARPYSRMTRVTENVAIKPGENDIALLWSDSTPGIAFWSLGKVSGTPFRSLDPHEIGITISSVKSVPGEKSHLKILESTSSSEFYVLDLDKRQSAPMLANAAGFTLSVAPDGGRAWALRPSSAQFASIRLSDLHPTSVEVERKVISVFDIARSDEGRALIALHVSDSSSASHAGLGATVLDALDPDTARSRYFGGLMLGGLH